ncbi:MAG: 3-hydroxyacyl-CoA dehydrogenase family protein [Bacteroidetes bacterium]|nr:3-hydroxyacyl-CoA dehydrogenase family protein [Bacteroidota bacterium]
MSYEERLQNVTVLGAAGKMGSGILLLTAVEMADLMLKPENKSKTFVLNAVDVSKEGLAGLMKYLRSQVLKVAEKKTVPLRKAYADRKDLIENSEIINQYIEDVVRIVHPSTRMEATYDSTLVFEAINENKDLKIKILSQIDKNNPHKPWFFTNTSSVPIHIIDDGVGLDGRVLGFHFYNPPAVQKLVEFIVTNQTSKDITEFAKVYAKNLKKVVVPSNDVAGFIGNGHFMRDALHAIHEVEKLSDEMPFEQAVYMINRVSQEYLVRPMGIFQLIDYVGIDVVRFIMQVMNPYMRDEELHSPLLDKMINLDIKGGQHSDGSQKDGFLKYEKGKPVGIYSPEKKEYIAIEDFKAQCDEKLGALPDSVVAWKSVVRMKNKDEVLKNYFDELNVLNALGADLATKYGKRSKEIGKKLVSDNVALNEEDVNTVLMTGFFHAYGPINNYFN